MSYRTLQKLRWEIFSCSFWISKFCFTYHYHFPTAITQSSVYFFFAIGNCSTIGSSSFTCTLIWDSSTVFRSVLKNVWPLKSARKVLSNGIGTIVLSQIVQKWQRSKDSYGDSQTWFLTFLLLSPFPYPSLLPQWIPLEIGSSGQFHAFSNIVLGIMVSYISLSRILALL